jgi:hypothetical protein
MIGGTLGHLLIRVVAKDGILAGNNQVLRFNSLIILANGISQSFHNKVSLRSKASTNGVNRALLKVILTNLEIGEISAPTSNGLPKGKLKTSYSK